MIIMIGIEKFKDEPQLFIVLSKKNKGEKYD